MLLAPPPRAPKKIYTCAEEQIRKLRARANGGSSLCFTTLDYYSLPCSTQRLAGPLCGGRRGDRK